jgi:CubicO group peptidase (beta-lactamase class C family)
MMLVEEGKLRLDEPVDRLLPELADRKVLRSLESAIDDTVPATRAITTRDLLTMRAGYGMIMAPPGTYPIQKMISDLDLGPGPVGPPFEPDEMMRRFRGVPLLHQPGERWMYHTAFDILGVLVSRAAAMPFADFLADRIFAPLGMRDTGFTVPEEKFERLAESYIFNGKLVPFEAGMGGQSVKGKMFPSASSGLVSTIDDYLAFGKMMLNFGKHGSTRLLARPTVEVMTSDQLLPGHKSPASFFPGFWDNQGWGFGVSVVTKRDGISAVPGRFGWTGGLGTIWMSDPREDMVTIFLGQRAYDETVAGLHNDFLTLAYQAMDD